MPLGCAWQLLKQSVVELAEWLDRWQDTEGAQQLADQVREAWLECVARNFEVPRRQGRGERLAEVIPLTPPTKRQ